MPTDRGLALFGVLKRADPAVVDPGVTAELECLLDDVLTGRQEMTGAIDAVCDSARRIIGRLGERGADGEDVILGEADGDGGDRPPTAKMRKFAASIAKSKGIKPPAGYTKSAALCRAFLDGHAPMRSPGAGAGSEFGRRDGRRRITGRENTQGGRSPAGHGEAEIERIASGVRAGACPQRSLGQYGRGECGFSDAASDTIRKQGSGVQHGRPVRGGWLVRAARRGSRRIPRAGMAVVRQGSAP